MKRKEKKKQTCEHTHTRASNEIHSLKMYSLPDRDNIKSGMGRGKNCHSSLVKLGYRKDPLPRPFITKWCIIPVGLWGRPWQGEGGGPRRTKKQTETGDRSWQVIMCVPSHCPFPVLLHPCSVLWLSAPKAHLPNKLPLTNRVKWDPDYTTLTSATPITHN